jgi:hypothetical protein
MKLLRRHAFAARRPTKNPLEAASRSIKLWLDSRAKLRQGAGPRGESWAEGDCGSSAYAPKHRPSSSYPDRRSFWRRTSMEARGVANGGGEESRLGCLKLMALN